MQYLHYTAYWLTISFIQIARGVTGKCVIRVWPRNSVCTTDSHNSTCAGSSIQLVARGENHSWYWFISERCNIKNNWLTYHYYLCRIHRQAHHLCSIQSVCTCQDQLLLWQLPHWCSWCSHGSGTGQHWHHQSVSCIWTQNLQNRNKMTVLWF